MATISHENAQFDLINGIKCEILTDQTFGDFEVGKSYCYNGTVFTICGTTKKGTSAKKYVYTIDGDSKEYSHDITNLKKRLGCEVINNYNRSQSANDTPNGAASKSKRTAQETATAVVDKYNSVISKVRDQVSKLVATDSITAALNALIEAIETARDQRVEAINNAALAAHNKRMQEIENIEFDLPLLQEQINEAMKAMDFAKVASLGKQAQELQAHMLLLQQQEAAYNATLATASEDTDTDTDTDTEAQE